MRTLSFFYLIIRHSRITALTLILISGCTSYYCNPSGVPIAFVCCVSLKVNPATDNPLANHATHDKELMVRMAIIKTARDTQPYGGLESKKAINRAMSENMDTNQVFDVGEISFVGTF